MRQNRLNPLILLATTLLCTSCTTVLVKKPGAEETEAAYVHESKGEYSEALKSYGSALNKAWGSRQRAQILVNMADYYGNGQAGSVDQAKRLSLLNEAASLDYPPATYALATMYRKGEGVERDAPRAYYLYSTVANDLPKARLAMTEMKNGREIDETKVTVDPNFSPATLGEIEAMVKNDDDGAMVTLAQFYRKGIYVPKDVKKAEEWYRKAIALGNSQASIELAQMWLEEKNRKNPAADATNLLTQAANQGDGEAMYRIGNLYADGTLGAPNMVQAVAWYNKGAAAKNANSMTALGRLLLTGTNGVPANPAEGIRQLTAAAAADSGGANVELGKISLYGLYGTPQDQTRGMAYLKRGAELGAASALVELGRAYEHGVGVRQDMTQAIALYREAASHQVASAMLALGDLYREGRGVPRDYAQAQSYYLNAAQLGTASAMRRVGHMYAMGEGSARSPEQAFFWYSKAAAANDPMAMYYLGSAYTSGMGVMQSDSEALQWFQKSAQLGNYRAMTELAYLYDQGKGTAKDPAQAQAWLKRVVQEAPRKLLSVAKSYSKGTTVPLNVAKGHRIYEMGARAGLKDATVALDKLDNPHSQKFASPEAAFAFYKAAAARGEREGMVGLGDAYASGEGTAQDNAQAFSWYEKSAKLGAPEGMAALGKAYQLGIGTTADDTKSFEWYLKAAQGANAEGQYQTGVNYARGRGTTKNPAEAARWLNLAEKNGYPGAASMIKTLAQ